MTIYKVSKGSGDGKANKRIYKPPQSVVFTTDDTMPFSTKSDEAFLDSDSVSVVRDKARTTFEQRAMRYCAIAVFVALFVFAAFIGCFIYRQMKHYKPAIETIQVQFHEYRRISQKVMDASDDVILNRIDGAFHQQVEIDWKFEMYEKLNVPSFVDSKESIIVNDFVTNLTAIVQRDTSRCFIVPLNRSIIITPLEFYEKVVMYKSGHSFLSARVVRENYRVITQPIKDLVPFGRFIWGSCHYYNTYRLTGADDTVAMSNTVVPCPFAGDTFSLGQTGYPLMVLVTLESCI